MVWSRSDLRDSEDAVLLLILLQTGTNAAVGFVSYRIVKGQGFYQPRRHRPLVGPYAVPKRIPVIAGNC